VGPDLDLLIALVKRARWRRSSRRRPSSGARRVRLVLTRRTQADHTKVARLQAIATEAAEQTGRLDVPEVVAPEPLERLLGAGTRARAGLLRRGGAAPGAGGPGRAGPEALGGADRPGGRASTRRSASGSAACPS
jgi:16S rRNA (uracil1498-N3)-methyltransferase